MKIADLIRRMSELGASAEAIAVAVEAVEAAEARDAERRAKQAARKRKSRDSHATVTGQGRDSHTDTPSPPSPSSSPSTPPLITTPSTPSPKPLASLARANDWPRDYREQFWAVYPKRVGKGAAMKRLEAIHKADRVAFPVILNAARLYAEHVKGSDPRYTAHPATWLNEGRWDDELPAPTRMHATGPPRSSRTNGFAAIAMEGLLDAQRDPGTDDHDAEGDGDLFAAHGGAVPDFAGS